MAPLLALTLYCIFAVTALSIERKANPEPTGALWIPLLWILVAASKPVGTWFGTAGGEDGSVLDQYFGIALLLAGLLVLANRPFSLWGALGSNAWLLALLLWMALSVSWSDMPDTAFKRWGREVVAVVMACVVASEPQPKQALEAIFRRLAYLLIPASLVLIKYFPDLGVQYRAMGGQMWIGATLQKTGLGRLCLIGRFFLIWSLVRTWRSRQVPAIRRQRGADFFVLSLALFLLLGPGDQYSATALAAFGIGMTAYLWLLWKHRRGALPARWLLVSTVAAFVVVGTMQPFNEGAAVHSVADDLGRDATLTGRVEIWAGLSEVVSRQPFFGSGVSSFWTNERRQTHQIGEAHNGYLEVVLALGFVGLALTAMFVLASCAKARRAMTVDFDWGCLWYCLLLMATVHNITESSFNSFTTHLMATLVFLTFVVRGDNVSPVPAGHPADDDAACGTLPSGQHGTA
jgi:O-antigen ligase